MREPKRFVIKISIDILPLRLLFYSQGFILIPPLLIQRCNGTNAVPGYLEVSMGWPCISLPWGGWQCPRYSNLLGDWHNSYADFILTILSIQYSSKHKQASSPHQHATPKIMIRRGNPAKCPCLAKNPPKHTTAYIVQQSNCRWHCEPTFFLGRAFNKEKSIHAFPLQFLHLLSLHLYPSLSKPSVSSPWSI